MSNPRKNGWLPEHLECLREHYPNHGSAFVAEKIGKTLGAVSTKAVLLGLKCNKRGVHQRRVEPSAKKAPARGPGYSDTAPDTSKAVKTVYATPMPRFHVPDSFKGPFGLCEPGRDPMTGRAWSGSRKG